MKAHLSVVVPAYNEAARIVDTLTAIGRYLDAAGHTYELIVSADGTDGTRERAQAAADRDDRIRVIGTPQRGGKGRGIRHGVALARGNVIGFVDADYKTPIEELERVLPWFEHGYDIVIGSRALADARIEVPQKLYRRVGSRAFAAWMHLVVGLRDIPDTQCGFKFFRGSVARDLFSRQRIDGYMFDVEILHLAQRSAYRIKQVGIRWQDDADSRLDLIAGNWQNLVDTVRIRVGSWTTERAGVLAQEHD